MGVNAGYDHDNLVADPLSLASQVWQEEADKQFVETGIYVSAAVAPSRTVYRREWGCPPGGEDTVVISGLRNPAFDSEETYCGEFEGRDDSWRKVVVAVSLAVAKRFGQSSAYLTFEVVTFYYLLIEKS